MQQFERPDVDRIDHLPPSIAIGRKNRPESGSSQLCDAIELIDLLAVLAMRTGEIVCPDCNVPVTAFDCEDICNRIELLPENTKFQVTFPLESGSNISDAELKKRWEQEGFHRFIDLQSNNPGFDSLVLVDRLVAGNFSAERLSESVEQAFSAGQNCIVLLIEASNQNAGTKNPAPVRVQDAQGREWDLEFYSRENCCRGCRQKYPDIQQQLFRRSSPVGACGECSGTGEVKVDKRKRTCDVCNGHGLNKLARTVRLAEMTVQALLESSCENLLDFLKSSEESLKQINGSSGDIIHELYVRLETVRKIGLGYLKLNRKLCSVSKGEYNRVMIAQALCSRLVNTLYIFDEPTAGLHQHDCQSVLEAIKNLRDQDNTVVMVEHNAQMISQADHVVELGPAAGRDGGEVLFEGAFSDLLKQKESCTSNWLSGKASLPEFIHRPVDAETSFLIAENVCCRNVQQASVKFPLQRFSIITGVSGSGKTSLLCDAIYPALLNKLEQREQMEKIDPEIAFNIELSGYESIAESVLVNDVTMTRSARSTPVTYIKAFDEIRKLFASSADAKASGFQPNRFSFNSSVSGRCTHCAGLGMIEIDMHFLANQSVVCPECKGKRFNEQTLAVKYRSRTIHDILSMTIDEAFGFFHHHQAIQRRLQLLREVGLGYLRAGQPLSTLSSGEAQRLKLASFLSESSGKSKIYLFDEPSAGLHPQDAAVLISCFKRLVEQGHTVIAIDHHPLMLQGANWVVDIGPGAASHGGKILYAGPVEELKNCHQSVTASYMA